MSGLSSILLWSHAPPVTAFPVQQTFPPNEGTGSIGSYWKLSGISVAGGATASAPSPFKVFAFPLLERQNFIGSAPAGGPGSDVFHLFRPIVWYFNFGL